MSRENKGRKGKIRLKKAVIAVCCFLIALGMAIGAMVLGMYASDGLPRPEAWCAVLTVLLILVTAASAVGSIVFARRIQGLNTHDLNAMLETRRNRMEVSAEKEAARLRALCAVTAVYLVLLTVLALSVSFFGGAAKHSGTFPFLLSTFVLYGLVRRLFPAGEAEEPSADEPELHLCLKQADYPLLYQLARNAGGMSMDSQKLRLVTYPPMDQLDCNAGVTQKGRTITLHLGYTLLCVLDGDELSQVFRHEFAHIQNGDTAHGRSFDKLMSFLCGGTSALSCLTDLALALPINCLSFEGQFYFLLSSRDREYDADSAAAQSGVREKQAGALAKIAAYELYRAECAPYENIYAGENIPKDYVTSRILNFREALGCRESGWRNILEHEIPARVSSHPTFRQRWETLGCCSYSLAPAEKESGLARECWNVAREGDRLMEKIMWKDYQQLRQTNYLEPLETIRQYEQRQADYTPQDLRPVITAYYTVGQPEKAEAICDSLIASYDSPYTTAFARFWKGSLLLTRYDPAGLDLIYQAMEANENYIEEGLNKIGAFCTRMGLEQEMEAFRSRALDLMQRGSEHQTKGIEGKTLLSPANLPGGWQERIVSFILDRAGGILSHIYLVTEHAGENYTPSAFVLRFREGTDPQAQDALYDQVFSLLDDWPEKWEFSLYVYRQEMEKKLKKVPGSCVYSAGDVDERRS